LIAKNIAPGSFRKFAFQQFGRYDQSLFTKEIEAAKKKIFLEKQHTIIASDIDPEMIKIAQENAKNAGVEKYIQFSVKDVKDYLD
jgi:putative N6-adenine-specific DNA methylase